ncbi:EamA-like transporter family protein [Methylobrevis pamukkalensis]|uniref:EamA-like transporter family protein n=1 Tax=Methylobrevis pamukkalensis TaxID=1439726 RepID=A0A1E3H0P4_9HYPH|nr:EamA-like transporter family protein [Methylobrevis pamukkalensis]
MTEATPALAVAGNARLYAVPALVAGAVAIGVSPVFVRVAETGPFASAFWRVGLAAPLLLLWAWREGGAGAIRRAAASPAVWLAGLFFAGDLICWHLSILGTTIANATLFATLAPVWVVLGSGLFIGEAVERHVFAGLAVCLVGAAILVGGSFALAPERLVGDAWGLLTSLFFGAYFLAVRAARRQLGPGTVSFASSLITRRCCWSLRWRWSRPCGRRPRRGRPRCSALPSSPMPAARGCSPSRSVMFRPLFPPLWSSSRRSPPRCSPGRSSPRPPGRTRSRAGR